MKKKIFYYGSIGVLSVLLMGACSGEEVAEKEKVEEKTVKDEKKVETVKAEEKKEKEREEPKDPFTPEDRAAIEQYVKEITQFSGDFSESVGGLSNQNLIVANNPTLLFDQDWMLKTISYLVHMEMLVEDFEKVDAPTYFEESNSLTLQATEKFKFVFENYPKAIDNMDADLIVQCTEHIQAANELLGQSGEKQLEEIGKLKEMGYNNN